MLFILSMISKSKTSFDICISSPCPYNPMLQNIIAEVREFLCPILIVVLFLSDKDHVVIALYKTAET